MIFSPDNLKKTMKKLLICSIILCLSCMSAACHSGKRVSPEIVTPPDTSFTQVIHPQWARNAVIYEVNLRQYTVSGTITDFAKQLPRLKRLGVDILWFMPIHPISELNRKGALGSYYAVRDYTAVNPEFGTLADFKSLVKQAHSMGFRVIIDWVANHSGCDNKWVSQHPDWYVHDSLGHFVSPFDWTDVYKFDYSSQPLRTAMLGAMRFWVKETGIDGFRCDVAGEVPTDFWNATRASLDSIKPVFMLAEADKPELTRAAFDLCYNWPLKDLFGAIARTQGENKAPLAPGTKPPVRTAVYIDSVLAHQAAHYPADADVMNMITNHDVNSWEGTEFLRLGKGVKAFAVLTYTLPGVPLIYTGQETGFNHSFAFFVKDTPPDWTENKYFEFYRKLNELKHSQPALSMGTAGAPMQRYHTADANAYVFSRTNERGGVYVFVNLSGATVSLAYTDRHPALGKGKAIPVNFFTGRAENFPTMLAPWQYKVLVVK